MSREIQRIKYFMPEWDDRYDMHFDFINDEFSTFHKQNPNNDMYAHEIFEQPPYDGILYSLGNLFQVINNADSLNEVRVRSFNSIAEYYHLNDTSSIELFGDCGAFNYVNLPEPPYKITPENVAFLYNHLGFQYGVSVDHLVVESIIENKNGNKVKRILSNYEKRKRIKISLENAEAFINVCKSNNYKFTPVGSAQGFSPVTYRNSVAKLVDMGYEYIALGGLVRRNTDSILEIVRKVSPVLQGKKLHLLGVIRPQCMDEFRRLGVTSVDSASYFRKAWLKSDQNYISSDGSKWYAALRVPIVKESGMVIREGSLVNIDHLEKGCLRALREYDNGVLGLDQTLDALVEYDSLFMRNGEDGTDLKESYKRTLQEQPWKVCKCPICSQIGIDVIIFRRTNRNKRRGLHNTWVFYNGLF